MNQPLPLREQLSALEQLQELDIKIDGLKRQKQNLPVALKAAEDAFNKVKVSIDTKKNGISENEKAQRQTQAAIDLNKDRLARANAKLETVQNSQEFQAANKEIDQLKKLNGSLDEQLKKAVSDGEIAAKDLAALDAEFELSSAEREKQLALIQEQSGKFDADISKLMGNRSEFSSRVEPRILSLYDRVRAGRGGIGIVPAIGGRCSGCNMMVPPQLYNEIQRANEIHNCPSCHRLLYVPTTAADNNNAANHEAIK